jgi:hypothetical protein
MDRDDCTCLFGNFLFDQAGVNVVREGVHIYEDGLHTVLKDNIGSGYEGNRWDENFVSVSETMPFFEGGQCDLQRARPAVAHNPVPTAVLLGKDLFQLSDVFPG